VFIVNYLEMTVSFKYSKKNNYSNIVKPQVLNSCDKAVVTTKQMSFNQAKIKTTVLYKRAVRSN